MRLDESALWLETRFGLDPEFWTRRTTPFHDDGNEFFGALFGMMFFKGVLASLAGPAPNFDMQRILATRNPRARYLNERPGQCRARIFRAT